MRERERKSERDRDLVRESKSIFGQRLAKMLAKGGKKNGYTKREKEIK